jgi:hypothetical protein
MAKVLQGMATRHPKLGEWPYAIEIWVKVAQALNISKYATN